MSSLFDEANEQSASKYALALRAVSKSYGSVNVLNDVELKISNGEFVAFVGPSGCGKSTMLRLIAGLSSLSSGSIEIDGAEVNNARPSKRGIAMVFQSYALYPHLTVSENIGYPLKIARVTKTEREHRVLEAAKLLQLENYLGRRPAELSGGQKQRVAIARALVRKPKVLLMDEPLSNLDAKLRNEMRTMLTELHGKLGNTIIYVTHDQVEALTMADKIAVINNGKVEQFGAPQNLYQAPSTSFVAQFIGSPKMNLFSLESFLEMHTIVPSELKHLTSLGNVAQIGIRPEHFRFSDVNEEADGILVHVEKKEFMGNSMVAHCVAENNASIVVHNNGELPHSSRLKLTFDYDNLHAFDRDGYSIEDRTLQRV
jgi:ABC-type sugar transport system ATPase subunit